MNILICVGGGRHAGFSRDCKWQPLSESTLCYSLMLTGFLGLVPRVSHASIVSGSTSAGGDGIDQICVHRVPSDYADWYLVVG